MISHRYFTYYLFKAYIRLVHETLMIRKRYTIGIDNLPKPGEKYFIICNHQNTANDPLNIMFALPFMTRISAMARADAFEWHPLSTRFLHWIGLLPAFRLGWEGGKGIERNFKSFDMVSEKILEGRPLIVFPEAGHTQGHYIDPFTTGVVRMAFYAAMKSNWQEDIKILPTAHHYQDYFSVRSDFLWMIGKPISLKPYYEEYQQYPNSVLRNIKRLLFSDVSSMMLEEGKRDYEAKDFLRNSGLNYCRAINATLPQELMQDKEFIAKLKANREYERIIELTKELKDKESNAGINDYLVENPPKYRHIASYSIGLLLLLPLWIISLWPHALCYKIPTLLLKEDIMFTNSYRYVVSALFIYPVTALMTLLIIGYALGMWYIAMAWIAIWIPLGCFCWSYYKTIVQVRQSVSWLFADKSDIKEIQYLRNEIKRLLQGEM